MADEPRDLVLEHLRAIRADISGLREDVREIKGRVTALEIAVAAVMTKLTIRGRTRYGCS